MILVDTSVWVDHLRYRDEALVALLAAGVVLTHPFVIGELACGTLSRRRGLLADLTLLPAGPVASHSEVLHLLEERGLHGRGIGWIDMHLLASAALIGRTSLWTRDRRLRQAAQELDLAYSSA